MLLKSPGNPKFYKLLVTYMQYIVQSVVDFYHLSDTTLVLVKLSKFLFLIVNLWLDYSFMTPKKQPVWFQIAIFVATWLVLGELRAVLLKSQFNHYWVGYIMSLLYLIPFTVVFNETFHAKLFIFLFVFSFNQCIFQILFRTEILFFGNMAGYFLFAGFLLEILLVPVITRKLRPHLRNILNVIDQQNHVFIILPILSFIMLAFYGSERAYTLLDFMPLILLGLYIGFSYYLIAISIVQTKLNQQLELTSRTDSLTGLYNRRHIELLIQQAYENFQQNGSKFALLIVDLDYFKSINDTYGHAGGDFLLKAVAEDISISIRQYDTVARWGGDEFLLLLPKINLQTALEIAERIYKTVGEKQYVFNNEMLSVTLTMGIYIVRSGDTVTTVFENADKGMYKGKRLGRNCIMVFDELDEYIEENTFGSRIRHIK